jgi:Mg-chelatase subunit ChlD
METEKDEKPEPQELTPDLKDAQNLYVFIVDRSGSMSGSITSY